MYKKIKSKHNIGLFHIVTIIRGEKFESPLVYPFKKAQERKEILKHNGIIHKDTTISIIRSMQFTNKEIYTSKKMDVEAFSFDNIIKEAEDVLKERR